MPFIAKKLPARRPAPNPLDSNLGLLAVFAIAVLILHLLAAAWLQQTAEKSSTAPAAAAMMLDAD
ncbi:hypothetical protein IC762_23455 [Bradyrhizobium genosp. L]|uniref:hypothetical protein n=1 Tax=Bradyrhizobium genosp. L TaxID=83637 RepID=UPI0018A30910|nr:hypothetical protein [Bradyrhizobium genosp. L]QPF82686.1 hypothetical protein IC762_23455 [Bradyrhizobium genosp. L]